MATARHIRSIASNKHLFEADVGLLLVVFHDVDEVDWESHSASVFPASPDGNYLGRQVVTLEGVGHELVPHDELLRAMDSVTPEDVADAIRPAAEDR